MKFIIPKLLKSRAAANISLIVFAAMAGLGAGCATSFERMQDKFEMTGPVHSVSNVFRSKELMTGQIRRVAVLPVTTSGRTTAFESGSETLAPGLFRELDQTGRFETVLVKPEQLRQWTGRAGWNASDALPLEFFKRLREATGCDAVLFSQLTHYQAYPPMTVGWRLQLVDAVSTRPWWACDEVFNAEDATVARAARRYYDAHPPGPDTTETSRGILYSPRRFGAYAANAMVATLPER
ncbi:MAG: hypothetical protein H7X97_12490 [Opitutaceae bacterium]|nr:hypothetical protein [Verrucomicrobiales bacterium]